MPRGVAYGNEGLDKLEETLRATNVISEQYARTIMGWALHAATLAFRAGEDAANARHAEAKEAARRAQGESGLIH